CPFSSFYWRCHHRDLPSFPPRRSSDLGASAPALRAPFSQGGPCIADEGFVTLVAAGRPPEGLGKHAQEDPGGHRRPPVRCSARRDRKSTRLNSSHVKISYAVFCLKKKT